MAIIADLEQALLQHTEGMAQLLRGGALGREKPGEYWNLDDFLLREAVFQDRPWGKQTRFKMGKRQQCFANATRWALSFPSEVFYCEGYAYQGFLPTHHGWLIDRDGKVIETTPGWEEPSAYFGIVFSHEFVLETMLRRERYGVIDDPGGKFPLLKGTTKLADVARLDLMKEKRGPEFYGFNRV